MRNCKTLVSIDCDNQSGRLLCAEFTRKLLNGNDDDDDDCTVKHYVAITIAKAGWGRGRHTEKEGPADVSPHYSRRLFGACGLVFCVMDGRHPQMESGANRV